MKNHLEFYTRMTDFDSLLLDILASPFRKYFFQHKRDIFYCCWYLSLGIDSVRAITVATSRSTSTVGSPDLENEKLDEQIQKVRVLRKNLRMNTEPSRITGNDELYVGGYVYSVRAFYLAHVISFRVLPPLVTSSWIICTLSDLIRERGIWQMNLTQTQYLLIDRDLSLKEQYHTYHQCPEVWFQKFQYRLE